MHLQPIVPLNIETIRAHKWCGNAHSDAVAFNSIDEFAKSDRPLTERAEAIRIMTHAGMGLDGEDAGDHLSDEELLAEIDNMDVCTQFTRYCKHCARYHVVPANFAQFVFNVFPYTEF